MEIVGYVDREGEPEGLPFASLKEGLAGDSVEDAAGTHWTKWTISERACTSGVLRQASGMLVIIFEWQFCISQNY